jgi:hypothetical protein
MAYGIIDDSTDVSAANALKFVWGDGTGTLTLVGYRIFYNGAAWTVSTSIGCPDSDHLVSVAWNGTTDALDVDLSSLVYAPTNWPCVIVSPHMRGGSPATASWIPQAAAASVNSFSIKWFQITASVLTHVTTVDQFMDCDCLILAKYS